MTTLPRTHLVEGPCDPSFIDIFWAEEEEETKMSGVSSLTSYIEMLSLRVLGTQMVMPSILRTVGLTTCLCEKTGGGEVIRTPTYGRRPGQPSSSSLARRVCVQSPLPRVFFPRVRLHGRPEVRRGPWPPLRGRGEMAIWSFRRTAARLVSSTSDLSFFRHTVHEEEDRRCVIPAPGREAHQSSLCPCKPRREKCVAFKVSQTSPNTGVSPGNTGAVGPVLVRLSRRCRLA